VIIRVKKELVSKVIIFKGSKILLLKRNSHHVTDESPWTWDLPGGHINEGETAYAASVREVLEETGLRLNFILRLGKDSNIGKLTYFYVSDDWVGQIQLSDEHEEYTWAGLSDLAGFEEKVGSMYYKMALRALKTRK
jgi:8-oxo-dGTP pyrophosphatase MutT (NUDIX family)